MKGLQVTKKVRSDEKGTKWIQRCYEISYEVTKGYEVTKKVRSYKKNTQFRKRYEVTKKV
jgi:hypothetical protein